MEQIEIIQKVKDIAETKIQEVVEIGSELNLTKEQVYLIFQDLLV